MKAEEVVEFLQELIELDPEAVAELVAARVPCSRALADHPTVQVGAAKDGGFEVGILGVLNGMCGTRKDSTGFVSVLVDDDGNVSGAHLLPDSEGTRA